MKIETLINHAIELGVSKGQLRSLLNMGYVPQRVQMQFHAAAAACNQEGGPSFVGYGGTRGQAKSHAILAQAADDMQSRDGLKYLYLRKVQKKALESFDDLRRKVLQFTPHTYKNSVLKLPNGSFMIMGGFRSETEIDSYLGLEYDGIVVEDTTTLSETKHTAIMGAVRTSRTDWRPRMYESANPGGTGHAWFRKMYYDPWRRGEEENTRFIHTKMGDNAFINSEYELYLNSLTGWLRRAWRDGDFEISAGQFFDNWDYDRVVVEPFQTPHGWRYWLAMDWGYTHWCVVYLFGMSQSIIHVLDEHAERKWQVPQHAEAIRAMLARNKVKEDWLEGFVTGADTFAVSSDSEISVADKFARLGMHLDKANMDRVNGAAEILHRLGNGNGLPNTIRIFDRCHKLIECLPLLEHNPRKPEDVLKVDADDLTGAGGDDPYDALRYGVMQAQSVGMRVGPNPMAGYRG